MLRLVQIVGFVVILTFHLSAEAQLDFFQVGAAKVDITPNSEEIRTQKIFIGGHAVGRFATGVSDPLSARALAISEADGRDSMLVIALDVPGLSNRFLSEVRQRLRVATGLALERIMIASTHTHSGPDFQGLWGGVTPSYREHVLQRTFEAGLFAWNSRVPATLHASQTEHPAVNRRGWSYTDKTLNVLNARSLSENKVIATLVNYAAHPVVQAKDSGLISRDFCGPLVDEIELRLGGTAIFVNGVVGDANPALVGAGSKSAMDYGKNLADLAINAIRSPRSTAVRPAVIRFATQNWAQLVSNTMFLFAHQLGRLDYEMTKVGADGFLNTSASYFRLGENVEGVVFPGESLTRNGLAIKNAMSAPMKLFFGLTNDSLGYFVPRDEWKTGLNGNDEESMSVDSNAAELARDHLKTLILSGGTD